MVDVVFATFRSLVGLRLSVQSSSTVLIQLVETGCVLSPMVPFSVWPLCILKLSQFELYSCCAQVSLESVALGCGSTEF